MEDQKTCTSCKNTLPISLFRIDKRLKSGIGSVCKECSRKKALNWRNKNIERARENFKRWAQNNKEYDTKRKLEWAEKNQQKVREADNKSYKKNRKKRLVVAKSYREANKEEIKARVQKYRQKNMGKILSRNKLREALKKMRTPKWLTKGDILAMDAIYKKCRELNKEATLYHVDHIIPLHGETVSGLHVPSNLQILTVFENLSKKNLYSEWEIKDGKSD